MRRYDTYFDFLPEPIFRALRFARVQQLTTARHVSNFLNAGIFAKSTGNDPEFPFVCKRHQSLIRRRLGNSDPVLQENKAINLKKAIGRISHVVLKPGKVFSFCYLVGKPTARKGYVEGMQLSRGEVKTGIGGGLCQLTNLLYWLALHSPLDVIERHHHSFDPFPDDNRTLPFGTGAGVFYNYIDLRFQNNTRQSFMFTLELTDQHLKGQLRSDLPLMESYHIQEENHCFFQKGEKTFRENDIFRSTTSRDNGRLIRREKLMHNVSEVKYAIQKQATDQESAIA
ncbi:MAG: VanW family protein [Afipia sp.]|nr:VanW family protein [Afipia sp.]